MSEPTRSLPRGLLITLGVLLAFVLAFFGIDRAFQAGVSWKNLRNWENPGDSITVTGNGKVNATPDVGLISLSVDSRGKTPNEVLSQNTEKMNAIQAYVKGLGIEAKDVQTTNFNLFPITNYNPQTGKQSIDGYELTQGVDVKVRKLDQMGTVLSGSIDRGANQVGQISFTIDDPEKLQQEARVDAIKHARVKAEELAAAAGVHLGRLRTFSDISMPEPPIYYAKSMAEGLGATGGGTPDVQPGSQKITSSVSVSFEIDR